QEHLFDLRQLYPQVKAFDLPPVTCEQCGDTTELDDLVDNYLSYAAAAPPPNPPPEYDTVLYGKPVRSPNPGQLRIEKRIEGSVTALVLAGSLGERTSLKRALAGLEGTVAVSLSGIRTFDEAGVKALRPLWDDTNVDILLADAPVGLVRMLPDECW